MYQLYSSNSASFLKSNKTFTEYGGRVSHYVIPGSKALILLKWLAATLASYDFVARDVW